MPPLRRRLLDPRDSLGLLPLSSAGVWPQLLPIDGALYIVPQLELANGIDDALESYLDNCLPMMISSSVVLLFANGPSS